MRVTLLKSKIHRATVTDANLNYEGSVSIDPKQKTVTIRLRITDNGKIMDFVGNGTHRIRNSD